MKNAKKKMLDFHRKAYRAYLQVKVPEKAEQVRKLVLRDYGIDFRKEK